MKESREEYKEKVTKELLGKLNLDMNKEYQISEINELLKTHKLGNGIIRFVPTKVHTGEMIIDTLVEIDMRITDAFDKEFGVYENKVKCEYCGNYYDSENDRVFQVTIKEDNGDFDSPVLCEGCRRKRHLRIGFYDFRENIPEEEKEKFIKDELDFGIDYTKYIEKLERAKSLTKI